MRGAWRQVQDMPETERFDYAPRFNTAPEFVELISETFGCEAAGAVPLGGPGVPRKGFRAGRTDCDVVLLPDGRVMVTGGRHYSPGAYYGDPRVDIFDPCTETWERVSSMPPADGDGGIAGRWWPATTLLPDGTVLVTGGLSSGLTLVPAEGSCPPRYVDVWAPEAPFVRPSAVIYDPRIDAWHETTPLPEGRWGHAMFPWSKGAGVFAMGGMTCVDLVWGWTECPLPLPPVLLYCPASETWVEVSPEPDGSPQDAPFRQGALLGDGSYLRVRPYTDADPVPVSDRFFPDGIEDDDGDGD